MDLFNKLIPGNQEFRLPSVKQVDEEDGNWTSLSDLILEKIAAHEATQDGEVEIQGGGPPEDAIELPAKVVEVYSKYVGLFKKIYAFCMAVAKKLR